MAASRACKRSPAARASAKPTCPSSARTASARSAAAASASCGAQGSEPRRAIGQAATELVHPPPEVAQAREKHYCQTCGTDLEYLIPTVTAAQQQEIERLTKEVEFQKRRANENAIRATDQEERAERLQIVRDDCVRSEVA